MALYVLLGFSAGLPFYMFSTVLSVRLAGTAWCSRSSASSPGCNCCRPSSSLGAAARQIRRARLRRFWGKRRGWIMLSQLGIFTSMVAMAFTSHRQPACR
jgi:PAT family beta-lactamase induction signal transducer AmpG